MEFTDYKGITEMIKHLSREQAYLNLMYGKNTFDVVEEFDLNLKEQG